MDVLADIQGRAQGIERHFAYRAILFIPSESYDAAAITVIQGLDELGFKIYTFKPNINSWFCNTVIPRDRLLPPVSYTHLRAHET